MHRVADIRWHTTRGMIGAKLHAASLARTLLAKSARAQKRAAYTWRFSPDAVPSVSVALLGDGGGPVEDDCYGMFASERTARNALARLARRHRLFHALLGVLAGSHAGCTACTLEANACACVSSSSVEAGNRLSSSGLNALSQVESIMASWVRTEYG